MCNVVGLSAYFHDSAACLIKDGTLVAAAQEERFSRRKHDDRVPLRAFRWCLEHASLTIADVDCIAYYEQPYKKLERQLWQRWGRLSPEQCLRLWQQAHQPLEAIRETLGHQGHIEMFTHHQSHAASAFLFSEFHEAAILTVDGVGEWATTTYGAGSGDRIEVFEEVRFPNSLGLLYSTLTEYLGFSVNDGEYKVMGLAAYGAPRYATKIRQLVESGPGGQFRLNPSYFDFSRADRMHSDALFAHLDVPPRSPGEPILREHEDLARSTQTVLEEMLLEKVRYLHQRVPVEALCLAGGVALNCVANARVLREGPFKRLFVQPAAGDAGGALGAAALAYARYATPHANRHPLEHLYLGPSYSADEVAGVLERLAIASLDYRGNDRDLIGTTVSLLCDGKIVGWFQGSMEFGPRALGARSILADPRVPGMRDRVNALIKDREPFRPFAPAVIQSLAARHFDLDHASPFMLETCQVTSAIPLPAVTHVDGTARVQTVDGRSHPRFAKLLETFNERTGCPVLLNTSFNLRDEPIVASPADALLTFARSQLDALILEDFVIERGQLSPLVVSMCKKAVGVPGMTRSRAYTF